MEQNMNESPKFGTHVMTASGYGVIVSVSKTYYGIKMSDSEVHYIPRELVTA